MTKMIVYCTVSFYLITSLFAASPPDLINYQGVLRDSTGLPLDGSFDMIFTFFSADTAGDEIFVDTHSGINDVIVSNGLFSVHLGSGTLADGSGPGIYLLLGEIFQDYEEVWLDITVGSETLSPRIRIISSAYALNADSNSYARYVTVAKSGGDFTSIQAAIDSITDASMSKTYLIWVGPGTYDEQVTMAEFIIVKGSGAWLTKITSDVSSASPDTGTVVLSSYSKLSDVLIENTGISSYNLAVYAPDPTEEATISDSIIMINSNGQQNIGFYLRGLTTDITCENVNIDVHNGTSYNYGVYAAYDATARINDSGMNVSGGSFALGLYADGANTIMKIKNTRVNVENANNVTMGIRTEPGAEISFKGGELNISTTGTDVFGIFNEGDLNIDSVNCYVSGATRYCDGIHTENGSITLTDCSFTGSGAGAEKAHGIYNCDSTILATRVFVMGENASDENYGLYNYNTGTTAQFEYGSCLGRGGDVAAGIYNLAEAFVSTNHTIIRGDNGNNATYGLYNYNNATAALTGGIVSATGGDEAFGIKSEHNMTFVTGRFLTVSANSAITNNYGIYCDSGVHEFIHCVVSGSTNSVYCYFASVLLAHTHLLVNPVAGSCSCAGVSRGTTFGVSSCP